MTAKGVYRMSSSGGCVRALSATRLGYDPVPFSTWLMTAMRESRRHQDWIIEDLIEYGYEVETAGVCKQCLEEFSEEREGIHVELSLPLFRLIGHMDGLIPEGKVKHPLEIKALSRFGFASFVKGGFDTHYGYASQMTCYMESCGKESWPGMYVVKNKDTGAKHMFDVQTPPTDINDILEKITWVEASVRSGKLCDAECDPASDTYRYCQFRYLCTNPKTEIPKLGQEVLDALDFWKENNSVVKKVEAARDIIKSYMVGNDLKFIEECGVIGGISISSRKSYSEGLLKELVPEDVLIRCTEINKFPVLRLKEADE